MGIQITGGKGAWIREEVLRVFHDYDNSKQHELTCKQIYEHAQTVESRTDLADALRQMITAGDLELGDDRQPGEPGGMEKGSGARAIKAYRLPSTSVTVPENLEKLFDPCPVKQETTDPLISIIDQLPFSARVHDGMLRAARLRRLAQRLETASPALAAELYEDASILEDLAA